MTQGYEVIYYTDVLDEYVMQHLSEFEDHKFVNVAKEDVKVRDGGELEGVGLARTIGRNKNWRWWWYWGRMDPAEGDRGAEPRPS